MSTPPLTFRKATPADAPVVLKLVRSAYRGDSSRQGWTTEADLLADERIDEAGVLAKISEPDGAVILAFTSDHPEPGSGGGPLGCCEVLRYPSETGELAYFGMFAVDPKLQAGGIGKRLLREAETYAVEVLGARRMEMTVIWLRDELIDWYVRRGYVLVEGEKRPFDYEHLVNGKALRDDLYFLVLRKELV
ncbi:hypothetical protein SLS53_001382 [Cytospora paraplurivora]|uniref:N-acetyltransferase domain-containing protein n=1 Tax=Cytospora paraplurivora TaxID=2898453 RepID=A0AAN9YK58_9PEZI